mmetsp:Transcript_17433/g.66399  ORF Transcript_17433/g.66399 Transcript_17433/m.66399 type:complete len:161 (-) Transcript_17433:106-588(-)
MIAESVRTPHPQGVQRSNTGVYNMKRIREIMALDEEARTKLAELISEDTDPYDLPGKMNDFDFNELVGEDAEDRGGAFDAMADDDFVSACSGTAEEAAEALARVKEWVLKKCDEVDDDEDAEENENEEQDGKDEAADEEGKSAEKGEEGDKVEGEGAAEA